jgi:uncharacterized membrane protein (DUF373 family)
MAARHFIFILIPLQFIDEVRVPKVHRGGWENRYNSPLEIEMAADHPYYRTVNRHLLKFYHLFEHSIIVLLLLMMMVVVGTAVFEMLVLLFQSFSTSSGDLMETLTIHELHTIFGFFLLILIGIELLETIKVYLLDDSIRVEIVFLVAMIGIARHVIDLDYKKADALGLLGMAAIILALTIGYYYLKKSGQYPWKVQMISTRKAIDSTESTEDGG